MSILAEYGVNEQEFCKEYIESCNTVYCNGCMKVIYDVTVNGLGSMRNMCGCKREFYVLLSKSSILSRSIPDTELRKNAEKYATAVGYRSPENGIIYVRKGIEFVNIYDSTDVINVPQYLRVNLKSFIINE